MAISTTAFDSADHLDTLEAIQEYLTDAFASDDERVISHAFDVVARAIGALRPPIAEKAPQP